MASCALDLSGFEHRAEYVVERSRIETTLVSLRKQTVRIGESRRWFAFAAGEAVLVELSHKHTDDCFESRLCENPHSALAVVPPRSAHLSVELSYARKKQPVRLPSRSSTAASRRS